MIEGNRFSVGIIRRYIGLKSGKFQIIQESSNEPETKYLSLISIPTAPTRDSLLRLFINSNIFIRYIPNKFPLRFGSLNTLKH